MNETKTNLTLKQRQRLQGSTPAAQREPRQSGRKEVSRVVAILLLLLGFGGGTALGMIYFRPDSRLQELDDMNAIANDENTPSDIRDMLREQTGDLAETMPGNLGRWMRMRGDPEEKEIAHASGFFTKSPADQLAELEKITAREKEWEAIRAEREAEAAANPAGSSQASGGGSQGAGRHGHAGRSDEQRTQRHEQHLANHPPQRRTMGGLYHQMRNAVRQQQGLAAR